VCGLCAVACAGALIMLSRLVGLVVVCVVVRSRVERVVAVESLRSWIIFVVIVACCVGNVLYRVLRFALDY
jgi:hypothetical protein